MTKRIYVCNVCGDEFAKGAYQDPSKIVGFNWCSGEMKPALNHDCENHVCLRCLEQLVKLSSLVLVAK